MTFAGPTVFTVGGKRVVECAIPMADAIGAAGEVGDVVLMADAIGATDGMFAGLTVFTIGAASRFSV